jgi:hypothetical protein
VRRLQVEIGSDVSDGCDCKVGLELSMGDFVADGYDLVEKNDEW